MAVKQKITANSIKHLSIEDKRLNDTEISGFHARISPKGVIKYYLYYRINGKQRNFLLGSATSLTPAQARDLAKEKAGQVAGGEDVQITRHEAKRAESRNSLTLKTFLDEHYASYLSSLNPKTAEQSFKCICNNFKHLADKPLVDISAWDIQQWVFERSQLGRAPATISYAYNRLRAVFNRAIEWGFLDSHALDNVKIPKIDNKRVRYLSVSEEASLLNALRVRDTRLKRQYAEKYGKRAERDVSQRYMDYLEPLVILAMNTGMRKSEMLTLKWSHVNMEDRHLTIRSENAKSRKKRTIPLNKTAYNMLVIWHEQNPDTELVFESNDRPISTYQYQWEMLLKEAGVQDFRFHDLRHHFASKLVMKEADLNVVRELLGHADLKMTLRYAHLAPEHKAAAVDLIG